MRALRSVVLLAGLVAAGLGALIIATRPDHVVASRFLDRHLESDGRVRRDSGDTVSEGQAYAMLIALGLGERKSFDLAWGWARENLLQPEGYLAWHWAEGRVSDTQPAPDADVDAAVALALAADRFGEGRYKEEARSLAAAVLDHSSVRIAGKLYLAAGPWATGDSVVINPSYLDPASFQLLARATGDPRWDELARTSRDLIEQLTRGPDLPPDWALVGTDGTPVPIGSPSDPAAEPQWGFDAFRVPIRLAAGCHDEDLALAARLHPLLSTKEDVGVSRLDGSPAGGGPHPVAMVGTAAAAHAAGETEARDRLLDETESMVERAEDYYSLAWLALGRLLLTTAEVNRC